MSANTYVYNASTAGVMAAPLHVCLVRCHKSAPPPPAAAATIQCLLAAVNRRHSYKLSLQHRCIFIERFVAGGLIVRLSLLFIYSRGHVAIRIMLAVCRETVKNQYSEIQDSLVWKSIQRAIAEIVLHDDDNRFSWIANEQPVDLSVGRRSRIGGMSY
jgi:hypothetical protein